jgi:hypothetical protein
VQSTIEQEDNYDEDSYYNKDDGDLLHAYGGMFQYEDEYYEQEPSDECIGTIPKGFPPKVSSYVDVDTSQHPNLAFNRGKMMHGIRLNRRSSLSVKDTE